METKNLPKTYSVDKDVYEDLLMSINLSDTAFSLFIAVSDDDILRDKVIKKYESDLFPEIISYPLSLLIEKPNLEEIITKLILEDIYLQRKTKAVFTVTGIKELDFINQDSGKSQQETFFSYLQWTRENFKKLPYPIIIWVDSLLLEKLARQAPDFWSWRKGVFRFSLAQNNMQLDLADSLTWNLCGKFEVPSPESQSSQSEHKQTITNYAEHVDDILYR
jgi:hypothetical protein